MPYTMHTGVIFTLTDDIDREEHEARDRAADARREEMMMERGR
jgi:hypothetical protein